MQRVLRPGGRHSGAGDARATRRGGRCGAAGGAVRRLVRRGRVARQGGRSRRAGGTTGSMARWTMRHGGWHGAASERRGGQHSMAAAQRAGSMGGISPLLPPPACPYFKCKGYLGARRQPGGGARGADLTRRSKTRGGSAPTRRRDTSRADSAKDCSLLLFLFCFETRASRVQGS